MNRRWVPWLIGGVGGVVIVATIVLMTLNSTLSEDPFTLVFLLVIACYLGVSAVLCARLPSNPIGWLLLTVGFGILASGFCAEYATYALGTSPGTVPFGLAAAWIQSWGFFTVGAIPIVLLLFPTGRVPSPRWRWVLYGAIVAPVMLAVVTWFNAGPMDVATGVTPANPLGIDGFDPIATAINWVAGIAFAVLAVGSVVSIVIRFRRAHGDERQQLRWLATVALLCAAFLLAVLATSIGLPPNGSSKLNDFAFALFLISVGIGIPVAIAVSLLRYHLYDLDVVVKKAVVATVLVLLLAAALIGTLLVVGGLVVGPIADSPATTLVAGVVVGVLAWPALRLARRIADRLVYGGRATPYEVLTEFSDRMADSYATDDVLPRMAAILGAGTGAERVTVWLRFDREIRSVASWPQENGQAPEAVDDIAELGPNAFDVRHQGDELGAITVEMPANDPMTPSKERLIRDLAAQAGLVLRNVRLIEDLRASRRRLVNAEDEGRRRLERNIHDGAQQQLVALSVKIRLAQQLVERDPAKASEMLDQLQGDATDALENLRDLARGIYPPLLADQGLAAALEAQARKAAVSARIEPDGVGRYPQDVEAAVYFCCLEALQNVAKYAGATEAAVRLSEHGGELSFEIVDDGAGFDAETVVRGVGLQGMADRIEAIGGRLEVSSTPGNGTRVAGSVPVASRT